MPWLPACLPARGIRLAVSQQANCSLPVATPRRRQTQRIITAGASHITIILRRTITAGMLSGPHASVCLGITSLDGRIAVQDDPVSPASGLMPDGSLQSVQVQFAGPFGVQV